MKSTLIFCTFFLFIFSSCECTYQYGVYVKNSAGAPIKIVYKTLNDVEGMIEQEIELADGEMKRIIWTKNINTKEGCTGAIPEHCQHVAEYINAYINDTTPSTLQWCDKRIAFSKTDIQQAEFIIEYTSDDF